MGSNQCKMRHANGGDFAQVLELEWHCYQDPLDEALLVKLVRLPNYTLKVAEDAERQIAGYLLYERRKRHYELHRMAVDPSRWRNGIGRLLVEDLAAKLRSPLATRRELRGFVNESNTRAQLFLRACGWRWRNTLPNWYGCDEAAYVMAYRLPPRSD